MTDAPPHLVPTQTGGGYALMRPLPTRCTPRRNGLVQVCESSATDQARIWLSLQGLDQDNHTVQVELTSMDAWLLAEQLQTLARNHPLADQLPET